MNTTALLQRVCPFCGQDNRSQPPSCYSREEWSLKSCRNCDFVYLENIPNYDALKETFTWQKTLPNEKKRRRAEEPLLHWLSKPFKKFRTRIIKRDKLRTWIRRFFAAGHILDVGCSSGRSLANLDGKFIPHGIEISEELAARANPVFSARGGSVLNTNAIAGLNEFRKDFFSGAIMRSFLEHETDPRTALEGVHRVLKPGNCLIVKVPNYDSLNRKIRGKRWCGFRFPDHVNYFTPKTLVHLLEDADFRVERFNFLDRLPTSDTMWLVARKPFSASVEEPDAS